MNMVMFEQLADIYVDSSKHEPAPSIDAANINASIIKGGNDEDKEIQLPLSTKKNDWCTKQ